MNRRFPTSFKIVCIAIATVGVLTVLVYVALPERFPIHFGRTLEPDAFASKPFGPFVLLGVAALVYLATVPAKMFFTFTGIRVVYLAADIFFAGLCLLIVFIDLAVVVLLLVEKNQLIGM